jgi:hypothetical protein
VPLSFAATIVFGLLGYLSSLNGPAGITTTQLYTAAAAGTFGFAIYTRLLMWNVIRKLQDKAASAKKVKTDLILKSDGDRETHQLVQEWGTLNLYRGILPLLSAVVGIWASVNQIHQE